MTANILTPGHIRCINVLKRYGQVVIGVLNSKALRGYKKEIVPFKDRLFVIKTISRGLVVPQGSLNPAQNIKKYQCTALASGDGFEKTELEAAKKLGVRLIDVRLKGERKKKYSSSKIVRKMV